MHIEDCYRTQVIKNFKQIFGLVNDELKHFSSVYIKEKISKNLCDLYLVLIMYVPLMKVSKFG
jgi:hypothetical protein